MTAGTIDYVDPKTLVIAVNVRTDVRLDPHFVDSIREVGILQPPTVVRNETGGYNVIIGQRRTLAAIEAGYSEIPVYVASFDVGEGAERLVDQITENEQRKGLTDSERVAGYKQLSLFGMPAAEIATRTATPRKQIDTALAIAGNEAATAVLSEFAVTLDQAAAIAGFAEDTAAVKALSKTAEKDPGKFDHVLADLERKRELALHREKLRAELAASGATVLLDATGTYAGTGLDEPLVTKLSDLALPQSPTESLTFDDIKDTTLLAGRIVDSNNMPNGGWGHWADIQWFLLDSAASKYVPVQHAWQARVLTPEQQAAEVERQIQQDARDKRRAAQLAASEVRDAWITQFLQRRTVPAATKFVAVSLTYFDGVEGIGEESDAIRWLKADVTPGDDGEPDYRRAVRRTAPTTAGAEKLILAMIFEAHEENLRRFDYGYKRLDVEPAGFYLEQLAEWGYGLSDYEQSLVTESAAA